jgi:hypothetical protein
MVWKQETPEKNHRKRAKKERRASSNSVQAEMV